MSWGLMKRAHRPVIATRQNEMSSLFDGFFNELDFFGIDRRYETWAPSIDITESDDSITVKAEIPGVDPKELDISIQDNTLCIKGEKKNESEEKGKNFYRMERSYGSFSRSITLPTTVDVDKVTAESKNGVLELVLQKKEEAKPKQVTVKCG